MRPPPNVRSVAPVAAASPIPQRVLILLTLLFLCALVIACSHADRPDSALSAAEAAITEAESAGARLADPVLLNQAQTKLRTARDQIEKEQYEEAERTLNEARVEAQLARARAETKDARRAVDEMETSINLLREQMNHINRGTP